MSDGLGDDAGVLVERERLELRPEGALDQAALLELRAVVVPLEVGRFTRQVELVYVLSSGVGGPRIILRAGERLSRFEAGF